MPLLHSLLELVTGLVRYSGVKITRRRPQTNTAHSETQFEPQGRANRLKQGPVALANEPRGPRRDVKPVGKRPNSTSSGASGRSGRSVRSSRDDGNKNFCCRLPCDSPRAAPMSRSGDVPSTVGDNGRPVRAGRLSRLHWPDNAHSPSASTSGELPCDKRGCSNDRKDGPERTTVCSVL
jgi:hypothetical protein